MNNAEQIRNLYGFYTGRSVYYFFQFLPGEPQERRILVDCCLWGLTESDMTEAT